MNGVLFPHRVVAWSNECHRNVLKPSVYGIAVAIADVWCKMALKVARTYPERDMLILLDDFAGGVDVTLGLEGVRFGPRLLVVVNGVSVSEHPGPLREVIPTEIRILHHCMGDTICNNCNSAGNFQHGCMHVRHPVLILHGRRAVVTYDVIDFCLAALHDVRMV